MALNSVQFLEAGHEGLPRRLDEIEQVWRLKCAFTLRERLHKLKGLLSYLHTARLKEATCALHRQADNVIKAGAQLERDCEEQALTPEEIRRRSVALSKEQEVGLAKAHADFLVESTRAMEAIGRATRKWHAAQARAAPVLRPVGLTQQ